jgi:hypothetical protein
VLCRQLAQVADALLAATFPEARPSSRSTSASYHASKSTPSLSQHTSLASAWERITRLVAGAAAVVDQVRYNTKMMWYASRCSPSCTRGLGAGSTTVVTTLLRLLYEE